MIEDIYAIFGKHDAEYLEFSSVQNKRSQRADLHAFMLLDELCPSSKDIVSCASHDQIFLSISTDELAEVATEEHVVELIRCGVRIDCDALAMFA